MKLRTGDWVTLRVEAQEVMKNPRFQQIRVGIVRDEVGTQLCRVDWEGYLDVRRIDEVVKVQFILVEP